jgi:hypothetical protein
MAAFPFSYKDAGVCTPGDWAGRGQGRQNQQAAKKAAISGVLRLAIAGLIPLFY